MYVTLRLSPGNAQIKMNSRSMGVKLFVVCGLALTMGDSRVVLWRIARGPDKARCRGGSTNKRLCWRPTDLSGTGGSDPIQNFFAIVSQFPTDGINRRH